MFNVQNKTRSHEVLSRAQYGSVHMVGERKAILNIYFQCGPATDENRAPIWDDHLILSFDYIMFLHSVL